MPCCYIVIVWETVLYATLILRELLKEFRNCHGQSEFKFYARPRQQNIFGKVSVVGLFVNMLCLPRDYRIKKRKSLYNTFQLEVNRYQ